MSITANGRTYRTLSDVMVVNGKRVMEVYANGAKVYPEKANGTNKIQLGARSIPYFKPADPFSDIPPELESIIAPGANKANWVLSQIFEYWDKRLYYHEYTDKTTNTYWAILNHSVAPQDQAVDLYLSTHTKRSKASIQFIRGARADAMGSWPGYASDIELRGEYVGWHLPGAVAISRATSWMYLDVDHFMNDDFTANDFVRFENAINTSMSYRFYWDWKWDEQSNCDPILIATYKPGEGYKNTGNPGPDGYSIELTL